MLRNPAEVVMRKRFTHAENVNKVNPNLPANMEPCLIDCVTPKNLDPTLPANMNPCFIDYVTPKN